MKRNKIAYSAAALALTLLASGCEEQIMEWKPGDPTVEISEIPLQLQEQIMLYKPIKDYVAQYHPRLNLAIGIGAETCPPQCPRRGSGGDDTGLPWR